METPRMRLPLDVVFPVSGESFLQALAERLRQPACPCVGVVVGRHLHIFIRQDQRHFWSPFLDAEVEAHPEGVRVVGRFGPHPTVWTLFIAAYSIVTFLGIGTVLVGTAQLSLGMAAPILWASLACAVALAGIYALAYTGQHIGSGQVEHLVRMLEVAAGVEAVPAEVTPAYTWATSAVPS